MHSTSTQETAPEESNGWELPGMELVGSRGSSPLGFMVIIALPSPKEEAANESSDVVKRQSLLPLFPLPWLSLLQLPRAGAALSPRPGP